jgi:processive 1,2-diacylglycerol beta-glucosyltransferase
MKKILILSSNKTGHGHKSIGEALSEQLSPHAEVEVIEAFQLFGRAGVKASGIYGPITRLGSDFWGLLWDMSYNSPDTVVQTLSSLLHDRFMKRLKADPPSLIVSIHAGFVAPVIDVLKEHEIRIPFVTLLADLVDIHPLWIDKRSDWIMCPSEESYNAALMFGAQSSQLKLCGFPTRARFTEAARKHKRKPYTCDRPLECLLMSGGEGSGNLLKLSRVLLKHFNCRVTVICGRNKRLYNSLTEKLSEYGERARILGFCDNVQDYMLAADVAFMRGSPNSMMEAIVCNTPLIVTGALSGQEERNPEFVLMKGLGIVCRESKKLLPLMRGLLENNAEGLNRIAERQRAYRNFEIAKENADFMLEKALDKPPEIPDFELKHPIMYQAAALYRKIEEKL